MTGEEFRSLEGMEEEGNKPSVWVAILIVSLFFIFSGELSGQQYADIGLFGGTSYYMGDINTSRHFYRPSIAIGGLYRYNFNHRNSVRFSGTYHSLSGSDYDFSDYFRPLGPLEFDAKFVDLALNFEFNWKPYKTAHRKTKSSPYVFAGIGFGLKLSRSPDVKSHFTVPFGAGYKLNVGRWLSAGVEVGPRRALSDLVDGVENPGLEDVMAPMGNRDWYIFTGVFVTYKIIKFWENCPTYDEGNRKRR